MFYQLKPNDSLESIAQYFKISELSIIISNSDVDFNTTLPTGKFIFIPQTYPELIFPEKYTYNQMVDDLITLTERYGFLQVYSIGKSVQKKTIPAVKIGFGENCVLLNGSHHAREWITTPLLMKFIELYCNSLINNERLFDFNITDIYSKCTFWIVPMVNPDGVDLCINGSSEDSSLWSKLLEINNDSHDFSEWKANIHGVDLNRNYDAGWYQYKLLEPSLGITGPSPAGFSGASPLSEPESQSLVNLTLSIDPFMVLAFHAQGEEIYYTYNKLEPSESKVIAEEFSRVSGYSLIDCLDEHSSLAGYKDWFIKTFRRPGFTIEVGHGLTPVPISQFEEIIEKNIKIILSVSNFV